MATHILGKVLPGQELHAKGFSFVWVRRWRTKCSCRLKVVLHSAQVRSPDARLFGMSFFIDFGDFGDFGDTGSSIARKSQKAPFGKLSQRRRTLGNGDLCQKVTVRTPSSEVLVTTFRSCKITDTEVRAVVGDGILLTPLGFSLRKLRGQIWGSLQTPRQANIASNPALPTPIKYCFEPRTPMRTHETKCKCIYVSSYSELTGTIDYFLTPVS